MTDISESGIEAALAPCPFCGCDDVGTESTATDGSVWCNGCRARITKLHYHPRLDIGQRDAIAAWNRRHPPASREEGLREAAKIARNFNAGVEDDTGSLPPYVVKREIADAILALIPTKPEAGESHEDYVKRLVLGPKTYEDGLSDARTIVRRGIDSLDGGVDAASRRYDAAIAALQSKKPE